MFTIYNCVGLKPEWNRQQKYKPFAGRGTGSFLSLTVHESQGDDVEHLPCFSRSLALSLEHSVIQAPGNSTFPIRISPDVNPFLACTSQHSRARPSPDRPLVIRASRRAVPQRGVARRPNRCLKTWFRKLSHTTVELASRGAGWLLL